MPSFVLPLLLLLVALGVLLLQIAQRQRRATGLPAGEVIYSDTDSWKEPEKPLMSRRYGLVGRPDYLVQIEQEGSRYTVPVEVKSSVCPPTPYASHVLQLGTYCLLVEDVFKMRPPHGLLRYADATLRIPYTEELRQQVLQTAEDIRRARGALEVHRQHNEPVRCIRCGYRTSCGAERLDT